MMRKIYRRQGCFFIFLSGNGQNPGNPLVNMAAIASEKRYSLNCRTGGQIQCATTPDHLYIREMEQGK